MHATLSIVWRADVMSSHGIPRRPLRTSKLGCAHNLPEYTTHQRVSTASHLIQFNIHTCVHFSSGCTYMTYVGRTKRRSLLSGHGERHNRHSLAHLKDLLSIAFASSWHTNTGSPDFLYPLNQPSAAFALSQAMYIHDSTNWRTMNALLHFLQNVRNMNLRASDCTVL